MIGKKQSSDTTKKLDPTKSLERAGAIKSNHTTWSLTVGETEFKWGNRMDRIRIIRAGLPYESIEVISKRVNIPIKQALQIFGMPQTTYNKKKKDHNLLSGRDSEVVLVLIELLDFGLDVFNDEKEKFYRWLKKVNPSLGGVSPESLFDSITGIQEVRNSLNRLEFGNMA
jgi:putative toxin-antitoxin system antitoxin component (TIGR02293 family)